jgi:hypothetical protein
MIDRVWNPKSISISILAPVVHWSTLKVEELVGDNVYGIGNDE